MSTHLKELPSRTMFTVSPRIIKIKNLAYSKDKFEKYSD